jgi:hypothetical protein
MSSSSALIFGGIAGKWATTARARSSGVTSNNYPFDQVLARGTTKLPDGSLTVGHAHGPNFDFLAANHSIPRTGRLDVVIGVLRLVGRVAFFHGWWPAHRFLCLTNLKEKRSVKSDLHGANPFPNVWIVKNNPAATKNSHVPTLRDGPPGENSVLGQDESYVFSVFTMRESTAHT